MLLSATFIGCSPETGSDEVERSEGWRSQIESPDAVLRAAAADSIAGSPGDDGLQILEQMMIEDPDPFVRERAVIDYASLAGASAIPRLKEVALGDSAPSVTSAALASLGLLREALALPPRAKLNVDFPETFTPGEVFEVRAQFEGSASAPKVTLSLRLPPGFEPVEEGKLVAQGALEAGTPQEIVFQVKAPSDPVRSGARVRLFVDYPEELESDELVEAVRVVIDQRGGRFEPMPAPMTRDN